MATAVTAGMEYALWLRPWSGEDGDDAVGEAEAVRKSRGRQQLGLSVHKKEREEREQWGVGTTEPCAPIKNSDATQARERRIVMQANKRAGQGVEPRAHL